MESFYGGRQGNPFIIVKRFDGIDIPQPSSMGKYTYRTIYCALDSAHSTETEQKFIFDNNFKPIVKTVDNQFDYNWKLVEKNGQPIYSYGGISFTFPRELAEGMVQCFQQGGSTTSIVNYGEYVLIDTNTEIHALNNLENGQVFRRGMDYSNELGGAEFIGNIIGPQGVSPSVDINSYDKVVNIKGAESSFYSLQKSDLIPGFDGQDYNDDIHYAWADLRDELGNIETCLFGFKFPYLVLDFSAETISPYDIDNTQLVVRLDDLQHPYYEKWGLKIPKGKHGDSVNDLEIITTKTIPKATYYTDSSLTTVGGVLPEESQLLLLGTEYDKNNGYASLYYNGQKVYVKFEDTWCTRLRYKETNYDKNEEGTFKYVDAGPYNIITKITTDENGVISVVYSHDEPDNQIGQLNYVLETIITKDKPKYNIPNNHLLVLYSNYGGNITYFSERFQKEITGYIDLGYVKGDAGPGLSVIASYTNFSELPSDPAVIPNYKPGDAVSINTSLYVYDYLNNKWIYIGTMNTVNPNEVIRIADASSTEDDQLQDHGVWFATETIKFAE